MQDWYGVAEGVKYHYQGPFDDPALIYRGYIFNYCDIEDIAYEWFREWLREEYPGEEYLEQCDYDTSTYDPLWVIWLSEHADDVRGYLDECISAES